MPILESIEVTVANGCCDGHFPGHPIIPGAVMVGWLLEALERHTGLGPSAWHAQQLKCVRELSPGSTVALRLNERPSGWFAEVTDASGPYTQLTFLPAVT